MPSSSVKFYLLDHVFSIQKVEKLISTWNSFPFFYLYTFIFLVSFNVSKVNILDRGLKRKEYCKSWPPLWDCTPQTCISTIQSQSFSGLHGTGQAQTNKGMPFGGGSSYLPGQLSNHVSLYESCSVQEYQHTGCQRTNGWTQDVTRPTTRLQENIYVL